MKNVFSFLKCEVCWWFGYALFSRSVMVILQFTIMWYVKRYIYKRLTELNRAYLLLTFGCNSTMGFCSVHRLRRKLMIFKGKSESNNIKLEKKKNSAKQGDCQEKFKPFVDLFIFNWTWVELEMIATVGLGLCWDWISICFYRWWELVIEWTSAENMIAEFFKFFPCFFSLTIFPL